MVCACLLGASCKDTSSGSDATIPPAGSGGATSDAAPISVTGGSVSSGGVPVRDVSGSGGTVGSSATQSATGGSQGTSPGCLASGQATGDLHLTTTDGRGTQRDYEVLVPTTYQPGVPLAITFNFHGAGGTSSNAKSNGLQNITGAAANSIFVFPQGVPFGNYGVGWDDTCSGYDVVFFDHMVAELQGKYCIDLNRIYVSGFSWGCDFVTALLCCRGNQLRGAAAASCSDEFGNAADYQSYANYPCPTVSTAAIRFTHDVSNDGAYSAEQFAATSQLYRSFEGCNSASSPTSPSPCVAYQGCKNPVIECRYSGLGHALPATWASDSWTFFSGLQ